VGEGRARGAETGLIPIPPFRSWDELECGGVENK
jgi:hypothetical protein